MTKKLNLDDLKVQSFVTTLEPEEARQVVGGTAGLTSCCSQGPTSCNTVHTGCCDTQDASCYTGYTDPDPACGDEGGYNCNTRYQTCIVADCMTAAC